MNLKDQLLSGTLLLDGAAGTWLHQQPIPASQWGSFEGCNEALNRSAPDLILRLHQAYLQAGAHAIETNTFGASPITLGEYGLAGEAYAINEAAARIARRAADEASTADQPRFVFGSIGPGTKLPSLGHIDFQSLCTAYRTQIRGLLDGGVDGLLFETCQDPLQIKAALAAAEDLLGSGNHIVRFVSITVETTGTLLVGTSVGAAAAILAPYPIDLLGINCATGPEAMEHHLDTLREVWGGRLACMPNAGMPEARPDGQVCYPLDAASFARQVADLAHAHRLAAVGGCCGTTPEHIRALRCALDETKALEPCAGTHHDAPARAQVASLFSAVDLTQQPLPLYIGERANATGSKRFREALLSGDTETAFHILSDQEETGAHVLDLSCGYAGRDELHDLIALVPRMARECRAPMMIDSTSGEAIECALQSYGGRALINSINLEDGGARADNVLRIARRYGAALVALTIDEKGMAMTTDEKVATATRLVAYCVERGLQAGDLLIDPLTFTVCSGDETLRDAAVQTLEAIRRIKAELPGVRTLLGLSNISFGLKPAARKVLNAVFLRDAIRAGMDACIIHVAAIVPLNEIPEPQLRAAEALLRNDRSAGDPLERYIQLFESVQENNEIPVQSRPAHEVLPDAIIRGKAPWLDPVIPALLESMSAEEILNTLLLPAMKEVGRLFNDGIMQLPFVLKSAEVMKKAVDQIKPFMKRSEADERPPLVVIGTVAGDVHDIGKNLVGIILANNGFDVLDLGIKVPVEQMMEALEKHDVAALGMSGLLVKSTAVMAENIKILSHSKWSVPVLLGGAALSEEFVSQACRPHYSGQVFYCKDAFAGLAAMQSLKETGKLPDSRSTIPNGLECDAQSGNTPPRPGEVLVRDIPVPDVEPGVWITESMHLDEIWRYLDFNGLVKGAWGYKQGALSNVEYDALLDDEVRPKLEEMKELARGIFEPKAIHGFFTCRSQGDTLWITDPSTGEEIPLPFPRTTNGSQHCLADYFRPDHDICALMAVTLGHKIVQKEHALRAADRYHDYLLFHGLAVMTAEALAEYHHKTIRELWGLTEGNLSLQEIWERRLDQGRFGFGYPACPDLAMNKICCDLLQTERIGLNVTELYMADPEASTIALITHHPQARH